MQIAEGGRDVLHERALEWLAKLRPFDDEFMRAVFQHNLPLAQDVLRTMTGIESLTLVREETQLDLKRLAGAKSVCLDVWGVDEAGTWHDIEVQRGKRADPFRARYYSAAMDIEALDEGRDYAELPEQWVIFVMEHDPFGQGRGTYLYERACVKTGTLLGDTTHILYVNGDYRGDDALGHLMHDFSQSNPSKMHDGLLRDRVQYLKRQPEGVAQMSEMLEKICAEVEAYGEEKGKRESTLNIIRNIMKTKGWTVEQVFDAICVPESDRPALLAEL